ncbi:MAG: type II secretion system protein [Verrucomicrobiae bacterium]|nr:type II secretion system protein [Verrucomicrobiae bacterium]
MACGLHYKTLMQPSRRQPAPGFTLIELLIVLAIMVILISMLEGFASGRHQRTQKQLCADNLQKIYLALQIYANDYRGVLPAKTNAATSEEVLDELVPKYSADTTIFICPGGRDSQIPSGEPLSRHKISYAYYMGVRLGDTPNVLLSDRQVNAEPKRAGEMVFSANGKPPGNNHHKYGGNFLMTDGSVQASDAQLTFSLAGRPGVVLLNPKP